MSEHDPGALADDLEADVNELARRSDEVQERVEDVREDWERKRADSGVPGAPPREESDGESAGSDQSPAAEAPPPEEGPAKSQTPDEGAVGPPSDSGSDS